MRKIALTLMLAGGVAAAQTTEQMRHYFEQGLRGEQPAPPKTRSFAPKRIARKRAEVWQAWLQANRSVDNADTLPAADSLAAAPRGQWTLPPELEPDARMPFYFGSKGPKPEAGYPLYLYLHGSGPKEQEWAAGLALARRFDDAPSLYFIPQIPQEGAWYRWYQKSKQFAWQRLLRQALLRPDVDPARLYVFGISEGGYGSQRLASFYADYWAAAGPMAAGEPLANAPAENLGNRGFILRTGASDTGFYRNTLTRYTAEALDSLERLHPSAFRHRVELIPGAGHAIDYRPTTPWLSRFVRDPHPRHFLWEDFEMDGQHREGFYNLVVDRRPDSLLRTRYEVELRENVVRVQVDDIHYQTLQTDSVYGIAMKFSRTYTPARRGAFTLYLNEQMVDLSRPVAVIVNGRQVFKGRLRPNTAHMLRSLSVFNDPLRIFPAAVRVNLSAGD